MEIILVTPRGFCAGVERAISIVEQAIGLHKQVYVYNQIVHNTQVVHDFMNKGVKFINDLNEVKSGILIFSAHGVSSEIEQMAANKGIITIDATCPLVKKVHNQIPKYKSREILVIGHKNHPEIIGTLGRISDKSYLIESIDDVNKLNIPTDTPLAYITQTTLSLDDTKDIIDTITNKFSDVIGPELNNICYATQNRQDGIKQLAGKVDIILILGSQNSSNSNRLKEIGLNLNIATYLIDSYKDIKLEWFIGKKAIGISAGASAPESLVQNLITFLQHSFKITTISEDIIKEENIYFKLPKII